MPERFLSAHHGYDVLSTQMPIGQWTIKTGSIIRESYINLWQIEMNWFCAGAKNDCSRRFTVLITFFPRSFAEFNCNLTWLLGVAMWFILIKLAVSLCDHLFRTSNEPGLKSAEIILYDNEYHPYNSVHSWYSWICIYYIYFLVCLSLTAKFFSCAQD